MLVVRFFLFFVQNNRGRWRKMVKKDSDKENLTKISDLAQCCQFPFYIAKD